jgi:hypothetical protein
MKRFYSMQGRLIFLLCAIPIVLTMFLSVFTAYQEKRYLPPPNEPPAPASVKVTVDFNKDLKPVSKTLFGIFFEEVDIHPCLGTPKVSETSDPRKMTPPYGSPD